MAYAFKWAEHLWTRLRRLDYWNKDHVITNLPVKSLRTVSPGSQPPASIPRKEMENVFSTRYFPRDVKRQHTYGNYPDTPLSLNHNLMKGKPLRPEGGPPATLPQVGAFGGQAYATPRAMGV